MLIETYNCQNPGNVWREYKYNTDRHTDVAKYVARERYAWPGGYELFAVTDDGDILCPDCCRSEFTSIATSCRGDGWHTVAVGSMSETDSETICGHCGRDLNAE